MLERILLAAVLVLAGVLAYQGILLAQRRRAARRSRERAATGRSGLLVFTSPTCAPCKLQQLPIIDRLLIEWRDKIEVDIIDVTRQPDLAAQYGIWSLPTTIVLDAQRGVVAINQGVAAEHKLRAQLTAAAQPAAPPPPRRNRAAPWHSIDKAAT
jgi:thioredoxin-like negative regulator of GroEL